MEETTGRLRQSTRRTPVQTDAIRAALATYGINPSEEHVKSFAIRLRERQMHDVTDNPALQVGESVMDILRFIKGAHDSDAIDEALWRVFLAAHFGRPSASTLDEVNSAGRFLCAFGQRPTWTWTYVTANSSAFIDQLYAHEVELRTLRFGNHRKYCSQQPDALAKVVTSFIQWVRRHDGSPSAAFAPQQGSSPEQGFRELYHRFDVHDFGRLGRFDLLCLLGEMKLLNVQPDSCYLVGSTGPLAGARKLCGASADKFSDRELGEIIDYLPRYLNVSYSVMEDTLCVWQKKQTKQTAEHSPVITYPAFVAIQNIRRAVKP